MTHSFFIVRKPFPSPIGLLTSLDSGHGGQLRGSDSDEVSGYDDGEPQNHRDRDPSLMAMIVIFPLDYEQKDVGIITDDVSECGCPSPFDNSKEIFRP